MLKILIAIGLVFVLMSSTLAATKSFCDNDGVCNVTLDGTISNADVLAFSEMIKKIASAPVSQQAVIVVLNSKGGDIESAIEIGKTIRRLPKSVAIIGDGDACLSACVFVLAGAVVRVVNGKVGIHRPYTSSNEQKDFKVRQQEFVEIRRAIKSYLEDMNLPTALYDEMIRIPSETIKLLSDTELSRFGLDRNDPVYQDLLNSDSARSYKLTKAEYLARKARIRNICWSDKAPATKNVDELKRIVDHEKQCADEVMRGRR